MRVRYHGSDEARDLALPGAQIRCERGVWVDLPAACVEAGIDPRHAEIATLSSLGEHADWDVAGLLAVVTEEPAPTAPKGTWAAYADHLGIDVTGLTKAELIAAVAYHDTADHPAATPADDTQDEEPTGDPADDDQEVDR